MQRVDHGAVVPPEREGQGRKQSAMFDTLARQVLPKLVKNREVQDEPALPVRIEVPSVDAPTKGEELDTLVQAILSDDREAASRVVEALMCCWGSRSRILTETFSLAAERLGELWIADEASFTDVTLGIGMLTSLMRELCGEALREQNALPLKNALILSSAGEDHQFGTHMFCQLLSLQGWGCRHIVVETMQEAEQAVSTTPYLFIGLSMGNSDTYPEWKSRLKRLRARSCNQEVKIIVGGPGVSRFSAPARKLDVDMVFYNGMSALPYVENIYQKQQLTAH